MSMLLSIVSILVYNTKKSYTWPVLVPVLPTLHVDGATGPLAAIVWLVSLSVAL